MRRPLCYHLTRFFVLSCLALAFPLPPDAHGRSGFTNFDQLLTRAGQSDAFTLEFDLPLTREDLALAPDGVLRIGGELRDADIRGLRVNGREATIDRAGRRWSHTVGSDSAALEPGVTRVEVRAYGDSDARDTLLGQRKLDVYRPAVSLTVVSGILETGTWPEWRAVVHGLFTGEPWHEVRWTAAGGPYHVTGDLVVPRRYRLVIEPGATLYFDPDTRIVVRGEQRAAGTEFNRIRMRILPGLPFVEDIRPELPLAPPHWGGLQFRDSDSPGNLIAKTDIEYAQTIDGSIGVHQSRVRVDDVSISGTHQRMIFTDESSLIVENSIFGDMFAADEFPYELTPPIDNDGEHIKGVGRFPKDGEYIIRNNYFGTNKGHNDVIDVDSNQYPDAILQIRNNYFAGAGDEAIDGGGDILVEGNVFRNIVKDRDNDGDGEANAISTGDTLNTVMVIVRNVFLDVDHVVNFKRGSYGYFEHNTVVGISPPRDALDTDPPPRRLHFSAISLLVPNRDDPTGAEPRDPPGRGVYAAGNIFSEVRGTVFGYPDFYPPRREHVSLITFEENLVESEDVLANVARRPGRDLDYRVGRAQFADPASLNFALRRGSPGYRQGPNGLDMGAWVPAGATLSGEPVGTTSETSAMLTIGGPGIFSFVYKVDNGDWSREVEIGDPRGDMDEGIVVRQKTLELTGLADGEHRVYVRGRDFAGNLQPEEEATVSRSWVVNSNRQ